jgi:hypothetical protein
MQTRKRCKLRCKLEDASWKFIGMIVQLAQAQRF